MSSSLLKKTNKHAKLKHGRIDLLVLAMIEVTAVSKIYISDIILLLYDLMNI